jgi:hypothetical protein
MGWARRHRRRHAFRALAAFLLQIAASFGHVDLDSAVAGGYLALGTNQKIDIAGPSQRAPVQNTGDDNGYCPICASIFLISTSFVAAPPSLSVPDSFERISHSVSIARGITASPRLVFRSRAPPAV